jgi:F420-dependent oxidoreductase-like protein
MFTLNYDGAPDDEGGPTLKLGISIAYWPLNFTLSEQEAAVRTTEELGFDSVWAGEAYWSDAASVLGWVAAITDRIAIGSAVFQIPARSPAMAAMTAATLDRFSGGRMMLGLGVSGPQVSEGWHGVPFERQLARTRDYVNVVRLALSRERVAYKGETLELPLPDGLGRPLKLGLAPVQEHLPILIAAMGPRNTALAGEVADGWLPLFYAPEFADELRAPVVDGAEAVGRDPDAVAVCPQVSVFVSDDLEAGRDAMRSMLALYVGGMGSRDKNFYAQLMTRYGFGDEARRIQDLFLDGRKAEAEAAVPVDLIDLTCICGPEEVVAERLRAHEAAGAQTLILLPTASDGPGLLDQLQRIAAARELAATGAEHLR